MQKRNLAVMTAAMALVCANSAKADDSELLRRIESLETRINELENTQNQTQTPIPQTSSINGLSAFNPYISVVLNGAYNYYSNKNKAISGFQIGEEGESPDKGFSLGESEINIGANVDDKFLANLTAAVVSEDGDDKIELEEAFIQSIGLPYGITATAGRLKPVFGYLNEKHAHTDEFADRPLPYRVFLNNAYKDDGAQVSVVLQADFYAEIGGGLYKGGYFPASSEGSGDGAANAYVKIGGDTMSFGAHGAHGF
ncbi:MAG: carbohydrate porin [Alphaproteobacteria bacterium]|nr:carbohydrate porin [Alphaproteobacteria bacterium]